MKKEGNNFESKERKKPGKLSLSIAAALALFAQGKAFAGEIQPNDTTKKPEVTRKLSIEELKNEIRGEKRAQLEAAAKKIQPRIVDMEQKELTPESFTYVIENIVEVPKDLSIEDMSETEFAQLVDDAKEVATEVAQEDIVQPQEPTMEAGSPDSEQPVVVAKADSKKNQ